MKVTHLFLTAFVTAVSLAMAEPAAEPPTDENETISGTLQTGESKSVILYFGEESGDYAGYCFSNKSEAGQKILAAVKNGGKCEITGKIDYDKGCEVPGLEATLSAAGAIVSVKSVKPSAVKEAAAAQDTPESLVERLYILNKLEKGPFFQTDDRAALKKYFTKDLATLIWKDAVNAKGEVGALDFDPLYKAQDFEITDFKIGKPKVDAGNTIIAVSFKNIGKSTTVRFILQQDQDKIWKIADIKYQDNSTLKGIFEAALKH